MKEWPHYFYTDVILTKLYYNGLSAPFISASCVSVM